jgi:hypothetical protein
VIIQTIDEYLQQRQRDERRTHCFHPSGFNCWRPGKTIEGETCLNMNGGNKPRRKGYGFEKEVVRVCRDKGIKATRTPTSKYPDVWINGRPVSCKRRKAIPQWIERELENHDYLLLRADQGKIIKIEYWSLLGLGV